MYVHINAHYKKSQDLEIYEMDYTTNQHLQDICSVKQPTLFDFRICCPELFDKEGAVTLDKLCDKYDKYLVKVKNNSDYWVMPPLEIVDSVPLSLGNYRALSMTDSKARYYTDGNEFFVDDSGLRSTMEKTDEYLKPNFTVQRTYDMITGSPGCKMPMQYHNHLRRFLVISSGRIHVKMTPWKSSKYLHPIIDYENYEFRSTMNIWNADANRDKMRADYDRIQFIEFDVHAGYVLYIPPYWWYSVQFAENENTMVLASTYDSAISTMANSVDLLQHYIQLQNNKEIVTRTLVAEIAPVPKEIIAPDETETDKTNKKEAKAVYVPSLSGEPITSSALELANQLQSHPVVPIREQHEQAIQHVLG